MKHDIYRLLVAISTDTFVVKAGGWLADLFAAGAAATGSHMAGRAEEGGAIPTWSLPAAHFASDLLEAVHLK